MTLIYIVVNNCDNLAVSITDDGEVKLQNFEDISEKKNVIYQNKPLRLFISDKDNYKGTSILLYNGKENNRYNYVHIGADNVYSFQTEYEIYDFVSRMGNNSTPYSIALSQEHTYYLSPYHRYTNIEDDNDIREDDINNLFEYDKISEYEKLKINNIFLLYKWNQ